MLEVSDSEVKPVDNSVVGIGGVKMPAVVRETILGAVATGLIAADDEIVSIYHRHIHYGYPTPSLGRDAVVNAGLEWLRPPDLVSWSLWILEIRGWQPRSLAHAWCRGGRQNCTGRLN